MKSGIVRRVDDLGRIAIPKEVRRVLRIHEGDPLEIIAENGKIILEPYIPSNDYATNIKKLIESIKDNNLDFMSNNDAEQEKASFVISSLEDIIKTLENKEGNGNEND